MEDERTNQKEFFEFEKSKKPAPVFGRIFTKTNVAVTLSLEVLVFISIGLIMLMVIIYALGIEKGKSSQVLSIKAVVETKVLKPVFEPKVPAESKVEPTPAKAQVIQEKEVNKPYSIVAVTFAKKDSALLEIARLKRAGYDAFILQSDSYYLACIGTYPDKDSAQSKKALGKIRERYKDAYFKLR
ncbi:MAG: SPOR domain-containing protein [Candidatus Omnitrophica bacterium]|nr:SPOR domain-containing protein [Candidatus Omnitrophota bacterium]